MFLDVKVTSCLCIIAATCCNLEARGYLHKENNNHAMLFEEF